MVEQKPSALASFCPQYAHGFCSGNSICLCYSPLRFTKSAGRKMPSL